MPIGKLSLAAALLFLVVLIACSRDGGGGSARPSAGTGSTSVAHASITDGRTYGCNDKELWFPTSDTAGQEDPGCLKFPITLVTINLLTLANRNISSALWSNIQLTVGTYQQIRLILASSEDHLTPSAPYESRFCHLNPSTWGFVTGFPLPQGPIQLGRHNGTAIMLAPTIPNEGLGSYGVVLDALFHLRGASVTLAPPTGGSLAYASLSIPSLSPAIPYYVWSNVILSNGPEGQLDSGYVIASQGGMITATAPVTVDLRNGNATGIDITMFSLF